MINDPFLSHRLAAAAAAAEMNSKGSYPGPASQTEPRQGEDGGGGDRGGAGRDGLVLRLLALLPSLLHDGGRLGGQQDRAGLQRDLPV